MSASHESHKPATKKNKVEKPSGYDTNIESSPRVTFKKLNPNPIEVIQQKTAICSITQHYCVICKKAWYHKSRYKSHSSNKCNSFGPANTKKDDVYLSVMLLSIISSRLNRKFTKILRPWRITIICCSGCSRSTVIWCHVTYKPLMVRRMCLISIGYIISPTTR